MPELPEVETIRRGLEGSILNKKIERFWFDISFGKKISPSPATIKRKIRDKSIISIARRSKLLIFNLSDGNHLLAHLKMTGQFVYKLEEGALVTGGHPIVNLTVVPNKFTRAIFYFYDNSVLYFNDIRKFGFLKLVDDESLAEEVRHYGIEPFTANFTYKSFKENLKKHLKMKIKQALLDQRSIAGLGNIYSDEVCFLSHVLPDRLVGTLKEEEFKLLFSNIKKVLTKAILLKGTSVNTYVDSCGEGGKFQNFLFVYGRAGEKCKKCQTIIRKMKIAGRTSSFCVKCQH